MTTEELLDLPDWVQGPPPRQHRVTAIVVSHNGATWLPATLATLAAQTRPPDAVVGVDTGSADASAVVLADSLGSHVRRLGADVSFGAAVAAAVDSVPPPGAAHEGAGHAGAAHAGTDSAPGDDVEEPPVEWLWLLHDDAAPDPQCLAELLVGADTYRRAGVLGPKALGWHDRRLLLELGFSVTGSGRRVTGLERREHDQGQHDARSLVHAVGSAGLLIRRDVWDALGGFDPALPLFRDDLDLCWRAHRLGHEVRVVPRATIHHREASYHGRRVAGSRRTSGADAARPVRMHRTDRRSALHVLTVHAPAWRLPFTVVRLGLGTLVRALVYVIGKDLGRAGDELAAYGALLAHPGRVLAARRRLRGAAPASVVRDLRPRARTQVRSALEAMGGIIVAGRTASTVALDDEDDFPDDSQPGVVRRLLARPGVWLPVLLVLLTLIATRSLWFGSGMLLGGALLPAPDGARDLWSAYAAAWHDIGPGSTTAAPPWVALFAALSTVLLGKAPVAVDLLILLASAAAAISAYLSVRGVVTQRWVRVWLAATYAVLPALTGAVATGRLGLIGAAIAMPPAVRLLARCAGVGGGLPPATSRTPWLTALVLAVAAACAPSLWLIAVVFAVVAGARWLRRGGGRRVGALAVAVLTPVVLLLPWPMAVVRDPSLLLGGPGLPVPGPAGAPLEVAALDPGGAGAPPIWVFAGLVCVAVLCCLRVDRAVAVLPLWGVGLAALALGVAQTRVLYVPVGSATPVPSWPGPATLLLGAILLTIIAICAEGLRERIGGATFGWRQPGALLLALVAGLTPLVAAGYWLVGMDGPLRRGSPDLLPAYVAAESTGPAQTRSLVVARDEEGRISYTVVRGSGLRIPDADVVPDQSAWAGLDAIVSQMAAGRGGDEVRALATYAIGYVLVTDARALGDPLVAALDSEPGLRRLSSPESGALWRVAGTTSLVRVVDPAGAATPVLAGAVPAGEAPRTLVLAQRSDAGWRAFEGDRALERTPVQQPLAEWSQGFAIGGDAGSVRIEFDDSARQTWLWVQVIALVVVIVLALPTRGSRDPDADDPDAADPDGPGVDSPGVPEGASA